MQELLHQDRECYEQNARAIATLASTVAKTNRQQAETARQSARQRQDY